MTIPKTKTPLAPPPDGGRQFSLKIAPKFSVDRSTGMLRDVALITAGVEAKGHGIYIDQRTIETCAEVVALRGKRLKAAFRHPSMLDYITSYGADRMLEIPGYFSGVAVKGGQLVAGAFQFFDTFKAANEGAVATLLEMAEKTPELFGVSIEPWGYLVFVDKEGVEYSTAPEDRELEYNGLPALRVTDLFYAAFVDEPAANPGGVFAALAAKVPGLGALFGGAQREQLAALGKLAQQFAKFCAGDSTGLPASASGEQPAPTPAISTSEDQAMNTLSAIHAKYGSDPMKFASACKLLAEDSKLTIDQIDAKLAAQAPATPPPAPAANPLELSAIVDKFGADKGRLAKAFEFVAGKPDSTLEQIEAHLAAADQAELKRLREENTQLSADKTKAEQQVTALKNSGHAGVVPLGATASAGAPAGEQKKELKGLDRVTAAFRADEKNPANAGRN